jgi:hypothetical protein
MMHTLTHTRLCTSTGGVLLCVRQCSTAAKNLVIHSSDRCLLRNMTCYLREYFVCICMYICIYIYIHIYICIYTRVQHDALKCTLDSLSMCVCCACKRQDSRVISFIISYTYMPISKSMYTKPMKWLCQSSHGLHTRIHTYIHTQTKKSIHAEPMKWLCRSSHGLHISTINTLF